MAIRLGFGAIWIKIKRIIIYRPEVHGVVVWRKNLYLKVMKPVFFWAEHRAKIGITALARSQEQTNLLVEVGNLVVLVPAT